MVTSCQFRSIDDHPDGSWIVYRSCGPIHGVSDYDRIRAMGPNCMRCTDPIDTEEQTPSASVSMGAGAGTDTWTPVPISSHSAL